MRYALLMVLSFIGISLASEGESSALFWKTVNTIILFAIVYIVAKKYVVKYFSERKKSIEEMIKEAEKAKEESERFLKEAQAKLEEAKLKHKETLEIAAETAQREREQALNEAKEMAERIKESAKETVQIEIEKGKAVLRKYAVEKAIEVSEKLIKDKINPEVNKQLVKKTLKTLEG